MCKAACHSRKLITDKPHMRIFCMYFIRAIPA